MGLRPGGPRPSAASCSRSPRPARSSRCGLEPSADTSTVVGKSTQGYAGHRDAAPALRRRRDLRLVREPVARVVLTEDLNTVLGLEGCLSGNVPAGRTPAGGAGGPCGAPGARPSPPASCSGRGRSSTRPSTQIAARPSALTARQTRATQRAGARREQLALARGYDAAAGEGSSASRPRSSSNAKFLTELLKLAVRYGLGIDSLPPRLDNPQFVARLVFDPSSRPGTPKARFASIFPGKDGALIQIRLRDGPHRRAARAAIDDIRAAVAMPHWRLARAATGSPARRSSCRTSRPRCLGDSSCCCSSRAARHGADAAAGLPQRGCGCCRCSSRSRAWR